MSNASDFIEEIAEKYPDVQHSDFRYLLDVARAVIRQRDVATGSLREIRRIRGTNVGRVDKTLKEMEDIEINCDVLFKRALAINHR